MSDLRLSRDYAHPPAKVWRALTERELLSQWLMETDFEPRVGHRFTLRTDPAPGFDGVVHGEVLEIDEPRRIAFSWRGGPIDTRVVWELEPIATGTRLHVRQSGFRGLRGNLVRLMLGRGSATLYGRRLPQLLNTLDSAGDDALDARSACPESGCLAALFPRTKR